MKIYFKSRTAMRSSSIKGKKVDQGSTASRRWAIDIKAKS